MKALLLLYWMQTYAGWRRLLRSVKTVKGAITALFFGSCILMSLVPYFMLGEQDNPVQSFDVQRYVPLGLFAYFIYSMLSSISDQALYFAPAEVDHFFPAPFHRKELLAYKMFSLLVHATFMAIVISVWLGAQVKQPLYGFVGVFATVFALRMSNMFVSILGQMLATKLFSNARKIVAAICLVLVAIGVLQSLAQSGVSGVADFQSMVDLVNQSATGKIVLSPFAVFANLIYAESFPQFGMWFSIASAMIAAIITGIFWSDANYLEAADRISKKRFENASRFMAGKSKVSCSATRWRLSMFPFWNGFGPVAWRQLLERIRQGPWLIVAGALAVLIAGLLMKLNGNSMIEKPEVVVFTYGAVAYMMFLVCMNMKSGFRADVDHIEVFKALPLSPFSVAAGELFGSAVTFISIFLTVGTMGAVVTRDFLDLWLFGFLIAIPYVVLHLSVINIMFLHFPVRHVMGGGGVEQTGHVLLSMVALGLVYCAAAIAIGIPAGVIFWLTQSAYLALVVCFAVLTLLAIAGVMLLGRTYRGFDVAKIPG